MKLPLCVICVKLGAQYQLYAVAGSSRCPLHYTCNICTAINVLDKAICGEPCSENRCNTHINCSVYNEPVRPADSCEFFIKQRNRTCRNKKGPDSGFCRLHSNSARTGSPPPKPSRPKKPSQMSFDEVSEYFYSLKREILHLSALAPSTAIDATLRCKSLDVQQIFKHVAKVGKGASDFDKFNKLSKIVRALYTTSCLYYINRDK